MTEGIKNGSNHNVDRDKDFRGGEEIYYGQKINETDSNRKEIFENSNTQVDSGLPDKAHVQASSSSAAEQNTESYDTLKEKAIFFVDHVKQVDAVEGSQTNAEIVRGIPNSDKPGNLDGRQKGTIERNVHDAGEIQASKCGKSPYKKISGKVNLTFQNRSGKDAMSSLKKTSLLLDKDRSTIRKNFVTNSTEKPKLSQTTSISNDNDRTKVYSSSVGSCLQSSVAKMSCSRESVNHSEHLEFARIGNKDSGVKGINCNSQFEKNSECVLNNPFVHVETNRVAQESTDMTDFPKSVPKRTSCTTSLVWKGSSRLHSIDRGLMIAQETSLMIVQTSSVCVIIPWESSQDHNLFNGIRRRCACVIVNPMFDLFITSVIFLNTVAMAIEHHGMNGKFESALDNINLVSTPN